MLGSMLRGEGKIKSFPPAYPLRCLFLAFARPRRDAEAAYRTDFNWCEQTCERRISEALIVGAVSEFQQRTSRQKKKQSSGNIFFLPPS